MIDTFGPIIVQYHYAMGLLDAIDRLITERGSAAVLREHLALIRTQAQALERQVGELQQETARQKRRITELEQHIADSAPSEKFVEHHGALFKRKSQGGYHQAVYCPSCQGPMSSLQRVLPYHCDCGVSVDFTGAQLSSVMRDLP